MTADAADTASLDWAEGGDALLVHECAACAQRWYLPRPRCPHCGSQELGAQASAGTGRVAAVTVVHRAPADGHPQAPFGICLVDLDEGVRAMCRCATETAVADRVRIDVRDGVPWAG